MGTSRAGRLFTGRQGMALAALALGLSVFLSRILGLVRDKVIALHFGAALESDIYFMAFALPDFLNYLLAGGYFSITLVPLLARIFAEDEAEGWRFFSAAVCWAALLICLLTLLAWLAAPRIAPWLAPDFPPAAHERLALFLRIILPAQICFLPGACFTAMLYHRRQFTVPALTPLVYNLCIIGAGLFALKLFPARGMEGFCWGVLAGAFLGSLALPVLAVRQGGLCFRPRLQHPAMKRVLLLALPLMLGQSIVVLDEQLVRIFGSLTGEGGVSLLNYARRIMLVPVGVVAQAAGLASYPFLAALAASNDKAAFDRSLNQAASNTLLIALPLSLWMLAMAEPIMRLIFQQGGFTTQDASASGLLLAIMLSGVAFWTVQQILGRAFYACQNTLTPAFAGTAASLLALPLYFAGARYFGAPGVAAAGTLGVALYAIFLGRAWKRAHGGAGLAGLAAKAVKALCFCLPACAASFGAGLLLRPFFAANSLWGAAATIMTGGLAFALVYLSLGLAFAPSLCAPFTPFFHKILNKLGFLRQAG